jgi:hypothetical protein
MIDFIRYSKETGFSGIMPQDKEQWMRKYPYINDFELTVQECEGWLSKHWNQAYQAEKKSREFLDWWLSGEWIYFSDNSYKEPDNIYNPKQLIYFINRYFNCNELIERITRGKQNGYSDTLATKHYEKALGYAVKLRGEIPEFSRIPDATEKPNFDLRKLHEWCIECEKLIQDLYTGIELEGIEKVLSKLNKLRELLKSNVPQIDKEKWRKIKDRIWKELETLNKIIKNSDNTTQGWKYRAISGHSCEPLISKMRENKIFVPNDNNELAEMIIATELMAKVDWDKVNAILKGEKTSDDEKFISKDGGLTKAAADNFAERISILSSAEFAEKKINKLIWMIYCRENQDYAKAVQERQEIISTLYRDSAEILNSDKNLLKIAFLRDEKLNLDFKCLYDNLFNDTITKTEGDNDNILQEIIIELQSIYNNATNTIKSKKPDEQIKQDKALSQTFIYGDYIEGTQNKMRDNSGKVVHGNNIEYKISYGLSSDDFKKLIDAIQNISENQLQKLKELLQMIIEAKTEKDKESLGKKIKERLIDYGIGIASSLTSSGIIALANCIR